MRQHKMAAILLAVSFCLPICGCYEPFLPELSDSSESSGTVLDERRFDTAALKTTVLDYKAAWSEKEPDLQAQIDFVLNAVDEAYAVYCRTMVESYSDWDNADLSALSDRCLEDFYVAQNIAAWFFANGFKSSIETSLFEPYIEQENLPYYLANSLNRVIAYARQDASAEAERVKDYYTLADEAGSNVSDTNKRCAKLYLDMLKEMDVSQALYDQYNRDYSAAEISGIYQKIREQFVPLRDALTEKLICSDEEKLPDFGMNAEPYALLEEYAGKISSGIAESAEKLFDENLYTAATGEDCYNGSFTLNLPQEPSGLMYTYFEGNIYDFLTVTHEFGHFHSDWRDRTPIYLQQTNLDIAEVQSQSMVTLFLQYYDEIFGENATQMQEFVLLDLLDALISGYAVGEFEYQVTQQLDTISPADTEALFNEIMEECGVDWELYQVSHLFEQPGYYISYGVSALPAIEMYTLVTEDQQQAVSVYDKLSSFSCLSGEYQFRNVMQSCGFSDYFKSESIDALAEKLMQMIGSTSCEIELNTEETGHNAA